MSIEAMKQALEALEHLHRTGDTQVFDLCYAPEVIPSLRQAIEQAEKQEPVAWRYRSVSPFVGKDGTYKVSDGWTLICKPEKRDAHSAMFGMEAEPLYTTPQPQREWVGLTDEEIETIYANCNAWDKFEYERMLEAKLKEKNT